MRSLFFGNKRGDEVLYSTVIFIVLNVLFFAIMIYFVGRSASGALLQEQAYAKEIALMIDAAEPYMEISLDMGNAVQFARKSKSISASKPDGEILKEIIKINNERKEVSVSLTKTGSYSFSYYSDYDVRMGVAEKGAFLNIIVSEKEGLNV